MRENTQKVIAAGPHGHRWDLVRAYLLVVQLAAIGAVCQWCLAADLPTTAIAAVALLRWRFRDLPG